MLKTTKVMPRKTVLLLASFALWIQVTAAFTDSVRVSLLTCSPGDELYTQFGHSAIRLYDPYDGQDIVFNYGIFDFDTPNFYQKFIRGKLLYQLGVQPMSRFLQEYQYEGRAVIETPISLSPEDKQKLVEYLENNYLPENRYYKYDFFFDNCSSRVRDVLEKTAGIQYDGVDTVRPIKTFRQLLDEYILDNPWADFGIDLILGLPTDRPANFRYEMFLPDYLNKNLKAARLGRRRVMGADMEIVAPRPYQMSAGVLPKPIFFFSLLAALMLALTLWAPNWLKTVADTLLFTALGLAGCLFVFMWTGTDHYVTHRNLNLLWANPLFLLGITGLFRRNHRFWFLVLGALTAIALIGFPVLPQRFHVAVIPILVMILVRCADRLGWVNRFKRGDFERERL